MKEGEIEVGALNSPLLRVSVLPGAELTQVKLNSLSSDNELHCSQS